MFCTRCGIKNEADATFCWKCGHELEHIKANHNHLNTAGKTSNNTISNTKATDLNTWGWLLLAGTPLISKFNYPLGIAASLATLLVAIFLIASHNRANKHYGQIILAIWLVLNIIGFITAYNYAQQQQHQTCDSGIYSNYCFSQ